MLHDVIRVFHQITTKIKKYRRLIFCLWVGVLLFLSISSVLPQNLNIKHAFDLEKKSQLYYQEKQYFKAAHNLEKRLLFLSKQEV